MKKVIKKAGILAAMVLVIGQFASCEKSEKTTQNQVAEIVQPAEVLNIQPQTEDVRSPLVFITGIDKGNTSFYDDARAYFKEQNTQVVEGAYSIEEIISWLNRNASQKKYGDIHIVSYNNPFLGMNLETVVKGEKVTAETLRKNITQGKLPKLKNVVSNNTNIIFHSQGIGKNVELMKTLKDAFAAKETPNLIASTYYDVFGGQFSNHYLADAFYVFYPTANSPGKVDLSKEIAKKYPSEEEVDWYDALNNETERYIGEAYTEKMNIPVKFEIDYSESDNDIPTFTMQEEIMDFIEADAELNNQLVKMGISVDKFRWTYDVLNDKLTIKGKTTVLAVLKPITKPYGELEHVKPDTNNKRLYAMK